MIPADAQQAWCELRSDAGRHVALGGFGLLLITEGLAALDIANRNILWPSLLTYALISCALIRWLPLHHPHRRFGWGNRITLLRVILLCLLTSLSYTDSGDGLVMVLAGGFLLLDGVDGYAARRGGTASPFGARFDLEIDALFVLFAALLIWNQGKAGVWILGSGVLRYGFLAASWRWPALAAPLPPNRRRAAIGITNTCFLMLGLGPWGDHPAVTLLLAAGLSAIAGSFAIDAAAQFAQPTNKPQPS